MTFDHMCQFDHIGSALYLSEKLASDALPSPRWEFARPGRRAKKARCVNEHVLHVAMFHIAAVINFALFFSDLATSPCSFQCYLDENNLVKDVSKVVFEGRFLPSLVPLINC